MAWIQTTAGAFSIVLADTRAGSGDPDPNTLMVRARRREHLEILQREHHSLAALPIIESPSTDYRWRIVAPKAVVADVLVELVFAIDYRNFKSACSRSPDLGPGYTNALHEVWRVLRRLQDDDC